MTLMENEYQVLQDLGLTFSQAKVYLTLVANGSSTARNASKSAQVARQDIYRILTELQQSGFVEKIITSPTEFKAIPIQEVFSILLERKINEAFELEARAREVIRHITTKAKKTKTEGNQHFVLIPGRETLLHRIKKTIENTQKNVDIICSAKVFPQVLFILSENINMIMRNGVKIRYIVYEPENANLWSEKLPAFTKNPSFEFRTLPNLPDMRFAIHDKKEVSIAAYPSSGAFQSTSLWSTNPSLVAVMQSYFEKLWITARKYKNSSSSHKPKR